MNALRFMPWIAVLACTYACVNQAPPSPPGGFAGTDGTGGFDGGGGTGGTGGAGATGGGGGVGGVAGTGGQPGTGGTGGSGASIGACNNQNDIDALMALVPTNARQVAAQCGVSFQNEIPFEDQFTADVSSCVEQEITGLSSECAACYGDLAFCGGVTCLLSCDTDACSSSCVSCVGYDVCIEQLTQCAGRPSTDCGGDT